MDHVPMRCRATSTSKRAHGFPRIERIHTDGKAAIATGIRPSRTSRVRYGDVDVALYKVGQVTVWLTWAYYKSLSIIVVRFLQQMRIIALYVADCGNVFSVGAIVP